MKKFKLFFITIVLTALMLISCSTISSTKPRWYQNNPKVEVINESTVIFKDVVKIEIRSCRNCIDQVTYVYDLYHCKTIKIAKGSFIIELPRGNYLVQSNKKITRVDYEILAE